MNEAIAEYERRYHAFLNKIANNLEALLLDHLRDVPDIDRIVARAKSPDRFAEKARRTENGQPKYQRPLTEIQDQVGGRVIVFYLDDVRTVKEVIMRYFQPIEARELVPESQWAFGYFGQHFVLPLPRDVVPKDVNLEDVPRFCELQIKTLFQHAWSEANHDLGYKAKRTLLPEQERRLAYTAAQAWGADRVFEELRNELRGGG
jgi:ppGpp synthetase/RelA/SpoT-type nucleotidyltranferase